MKHKKRILLVDDHLNTRVTIKAIFELKGHVVRAAENANRALQIAEVWRFDWLVTDIRMFGKNGVELADEIHRQYPQVKIIFITAYTDMRNFLRAAELGIVLTKPVDVPFLLENLNK